MPERTRRTVAEAIVLATGRGERGRALTESLPSALLPVGGKPVIDHLFDRLAAHGVGRAVVALHHHRAAMASHLARLPPPPATVPMIVPEALEAGSVVLDALPQLGGEAVLVVDADVLWFDGLLPTLDRLAAAWDPARMDALLLLQATVTARGDDGPGDYFFDPAGRARRRTGNEIAGHLLAGVAILSRRALRDPPGSAFGLTPILDRAEEEGRLFALAHDGVWFRLRDAQDAVLAEVELGYRPMPAAEAEMLGR